MKGKLLFYLLFVLLWGGAATVQAEIYSGECGAEGANVTWTFDTETGVLEISGTGAIEDFKNDEKIPWAVYRSVINSVTIGDEITAIGAFAFYGLYELEWITIPESVTSIGKYAFKYCESLESLTIPNRVTFIGEGAFDCCEGLTSITIGEGVTSIGERAFDCCEGLTSITIGEGVTSIGERAFSLCESLESVTIPNSVTVIGKYAFASCESLMSVTIGESVTSIGNSAFGACKSLEKFEGKWASEDNRCLIVNDTLRFFAQGGMPSYSIPNGVTAIGNNAFVRCTALTSVTIPPSVTSIGNDAFDWCEALESVTIGEGVTSIGESAFFSCESLKSVTAYNPTPVNIVITDEWEEVYFAFEYVNCANCTLYVPAESVEKYKAAEGWKEFGTILPIGASAITETQQEQADGHITVYNLQGVPVLEADDAAALKTLQNGAYIVNGKKTIIVEQ